VLDKLGIGKQTSGGLLRVPSRSPGKKT
jgi:hypothetical protein